VRTEVRYSADEFERESRYIENLIWDALVIEPGTSVLFCGYGDDARWVKRAMEAGASVTVIEHRDDVMRRFEDLEVKQLRGSTSVIPAKNGSFDLAVAFHYLHETDPFFHGQIVSELSRVANRVAIVEPGPPADRLGKKIVRLYSQAKRELGQFEYYQPLEYWRKLLHSAKADISQHVFAFAKVPPAEYLRDTIDLLLATMEVEEAPRSDLDELRSIAQRSDALILPPPRYVLVGAAVGELPQPIFTPREEPTPTPQVAKAAVGNEPVPMPPQVTAAAGYEFPPIEPPPVMPPPVMPLANAPGAPDAQAPWSTPFAVSNPQMPPPPPSFGLPWQWEPPEGTEPPDGSKT
jgi:ubiquinone/menaquinone biosynthesis C-methylase UbiE